MIENSIIYILTEYSNEIKPKKSYFKLNKNIKKADNFRILCRSHQLSKSSFDQNRSRENIIPINVIWIFRHFQEMLYPQYQVLY